MVGLGNVKGSQKTTPLDARLGLEAASTASGAAFSLHAKIELCETPVECDLDINEAAVGVAACKTGRPMTGLEGTSGKVEDLGNEGFLTGSDDPEDVMPPQGRVLVLDSRGMVVVTVVVGLLIFSSFLTMI